MMNYDGILIKNRMLDGNQLSGELPDTLFQDSQLSFL